MKQVGEGIEDISFHTQSLYKTSGMRIVEHKTHTYYVEIFEPKPASNIGFTSNLPNLI